MSKLCVNPNKQNTLWLVFEVSKTFIRLIRVRFSGDLFMDKCIRNEWNPFAWPYVHLSIPILFSEGASAWLGCDILEYTIKLKRGISTPQAHFSLYMRKQAHQCKLENPLYGLKHDANALASRVSQLRLVFFTLVGRFLMGFHNLREAWQMPWPVMPLGVQMWCMWLDFQWICLCQ